LAVTVSGSVSVSDINTINSDSATGVVTAILSTGNLASYSNLSTTASDVVTITVNDGDTTELSAADLSVLGGKTNGTVTVSNAVTISGTVNEINAALVTTGTKVFLAGNSNVIVTDVDGTSDLSSVNPVGGVTALIEADSDISANLNLDNVDTYTVSSGQLLTATAGQLTGKIVMGDGAVRVTGVNTTTDLTSVDPSGDVTAVVNDGVNISGNTDLGTVDNFNIDTGASVTMTVFQHNKISAADGTNDVTLSDNGTITGNANVESYKLATGGNNFATDNVGQTVVGNTGIDNITGGNGIDILNGNAGNDVLVGGLGDDIITGGAGKDNMSGGDGNDVFVFATGSVESITSSNADVISDFKTGEDKLDFGQNATNVTVEDGALMFFSTFVDDAGDAFVLGELNVYMIYGQAGGGTGYAAADLNQNGAFDTGDALIQLTDVSSSSAIADTDILTYIP